MAHTNGTLQLVMAPAQNYQLEPQNRSGVSWLVAKNYTMRFAGELRLPEGTWALSGVYLAVENAMLPLSDTELQGYSHGVISVYGDDQQQIFSGPFIKPVFGMRFENDAIGDWWTQVVSTWAGEGKFAGRILQVNLQGRWQLADGDARLVESGEVALV